MRHGPHPVPDTAATAALVDVQRPHGPHHTRRAPSASWSTSSAPSRTPRPRSCAAQAELTVRLDQTVRARHAQARVPAAQQGRDVAGLVAFARRESPAKGSRLLGLAHALAEQPHTLPR